MSTLAKEIREMMNKLNHPPSKKNRSHIVPGTPGGLLARNLNNEMTVMKKLIDDSKVDDNVKQEIEAKLMELGALVQKKLQ